MIMRAPGHGAPSVRRDGCTLAQNTVAAFIHAEAKAFTHTEAKAFTHAEANACRPGSPAIPCYPIYRCLHHGGAAMVDTP